MSEWVIEAENLTKVYKMGEVEVHALRGLTLKIAREKWWPSWVLRARENRPDEHHWLPGPTNLR